MRIGAATRSVAAASNGHRALISPREIHDPDIALGQLDESISFWLTHAIVVGETTPR